MNIFGEWIYWIQFTGIVILVLIVFGVAIRVFGWDRVKGFLLPTLGILAVFGFRAKLQQDGYNDRRAEEEKALDRAEDIVEEERHKSEVLTDEQLRKETDKWSKP